MANGSDEKNLTLSGNLFFNFLAEASVKKWSGKKIDGRANKFNQQYLLRGMMSLISLSGNWWDNIQLGSEQQASQYRNFNISTYNLLDKIFSVNLGECVENFRISVEKNDANILEKVAEVTEKIIDREQNNAKILIGRVLYVIHRDNNIEDATDFYIHPDGHCVAKKDILKTKKFYLPSFILGIWHYIVMTAVKNTDKEPSEEARSTYSEFYVKNGENHSSAKLKDEYKISLISDIEVSFKNPAKEHQNLYILESKKSDNNLVDDTTQKLKDDWIEKYIDILLRKYSSIKDLTFGNKFKDFDSIYISRSILVQNPNAISREKADVTSIESLRKYSNRIIITGVAGIGKTMLLKHLLLTSIRQYKTKDDFRIPIFVNLVDYSGKGGQLFEYIVKSLDVSAKGLDSDFRSDMSNGIFLFFFDGMENLASSLLKQFIGEINVMIDEYPENLYVISSRPLCNGIFSYLHDFTVMELQSLTKEQSLKLISRMPYKESDELNKFKFIFEKYCFEQCKGISDNPKLLSILRENCIGILNLDQVMHTVCRDICDELLPSTEIVALAGKQMLRTKLPREVFMEYLGAISTRAYADNLPSLTRDELDGYLDAVKLVNYNFLNDDFVYDLTVTTCFMYLHDGKFYFLSKVLQNYLCAKCYLNGRYYNLRERMDVNFTLKESNQNFPYDVFNILYAMDKQKTEEMLFLPYLQSLMLTCKQGKGYLTFLETFYPEIYYCKPCTQQKCFFASVHSSPYILYNFIVKKAHIERFVNSDDLPCIQEFKLDAESLPKLESKVSVSFLKRYIVDNDNGQFQLKPLISDDVQVDYFCIPIKSVMENSSRYLSLIDILVSEKFGIKEEYNKLCEFTQELNSRFL
ncbi:MAG: NACHT domain-containing protein [Butyrivibrio sp.]|nr:NACHT domain-containing protein [Butyrivibrio sp.]